MDGSGDRRAAGSGGDAAEVCVTGATGYIGSWLVRSLLRRGYAVHATARDLGKASQLILTWLGGGDDGRRRLKVFRADLREEGSFDEAVRGCIAVFHVAASMELINVPPGGGEEDVNHVEGDVRSNVLEPSARGTINLLRSCLRARGTVKRVVFTSSISTITARDGGTSWKPTVDESSIIPVDAVWKAKPSGWVYVLSKVVTEETAFQFAKENGIDLVSVIPTTVAGPFLTPEVPASLRVLLSPITGDPELYPVLAAVHSRLGSISLVHIEDICNAHMFLMEHDVGDAAAAEGGRRRYICSAGSVVLPRLREMLSSHELFPSLIHAEERFGAADEFHRSIPSVISSKRLTDLGFEFKYGVREIVEQSVASCVECGFLK